MWVRQHFCRSTLPGNRHARVCGSALELAACHQSSCFSRGGPECRDCLVFTGRRPTSPHGCGQQRESASGHPPLPTLRYAGSRTTSAWAANFKTKQERATGRAIDWLRPNMLAHREPVFAQIRVSISELIMTCSTHWYLQEICPCSYRKAQGGLFFPDAVVNQTILSTLAKSHTAPPKGSGSRDDQATRHLSRIARQTRSAQD